MSQPLDENSMVREYGMEHSSGAGKPRPIRCVCGRKLMVSAVQLARMSCTQKQRSGGAERDEAHVGGCRFMGCSSVMGIVCGCGSGRNKKRDGHRGSTSMGKLSCLLTHVYQNYNVYISSM